MSRRAEYWDGRARKIQGPLFYDEIALYKRQEQLDLISEWTGAGARSVLKTDLFEEAFGKDGMLDGLGGAYSRVTGMDLSGTVVGNARNRFPDIDGVVGDVGILPFKTQAFDLVISNSTLDHLKDDHIRIAVDEIHRVLGPGGCLVLTLDDGHNVLHRISNRITKWMGGFYAERCYTVGEISPILRQRGFVVKKATAIFHVPPGLNWAANKAGNGVAVKRLIRFVVGKCRGFRTLPTRFVTGRYIAVLAERAPT